MSALKEHITVFLKETVRIQKDHIYVIVGNDIEDQHGMLKDVKVNLTTISLSVLRSIFLKTLMNVLRDLMDVNRIVPIR